MSNQEKETIRELLETDRIADALEHYMESDGTRLWAESRTSE